MNICNAQTFGDRFQEFILPDIFRYGIFVAKNENRPHHWKRAGLFPCIHSSITTNMNRVSFDKDDGYPLEKLFRVLFRLEDFHRFAEPLRVHHFPFPQKLQAVLQVDVVGHVDQPLIRGARFFFGGDVLVQVGDRIAFGLNVRGDPGHAGRVLIKQRLVVVRVMIAEPRFLQLFRRRILREFINHRRDHFEMREFFGST